MRMTCYDAKNELNEARRLIERVQRATGNRAVKGSCTEALRPLKALIDNIVKVNFDGDDKHTLELGYDD